MKLDNCVFAVLHAFTVLINVLLSVYIYNLHKKVWDTNDEMQEYPVQRIYAVYKTTFTAYFMFIFLALSFGIGASKKYVQMLRSPNP